MSKEFDIKLFIAENAKLKLNCILCKKFIGWTNVDLNISKWTKTKFYPEHYPMILCKACHSTNGTR
jgi:hypothetical protein